MAQISTVSSTEVLAGLIDRVTFHNSDNGFCVLRIKARGQRDLITLVGHAAMISAGEFVRASGSWVNDRTHGVQFRASFLKATAPTTVEGIEKYLGSGMIRGIGPVYAKKLVRAFGEGVFDVIEQQPGRLREVTGIGPKRAERIIAGWAEQKIIREIMLFLHSNGIGTSRAVRIYKTYGADAIRLISENPYRLARDIRGIGFRTADQIAAKLGIENTALIRVRAGISYALAEAMDDGHCGLPAEELVPLTQKVLEVPADLIATALDLELQDGTVIADDLDGRRCVFLAGLYRAEREIAEKLRALTAGKPPWPSIDADKAIPWVEKRTKLVLAASQIEAIRVALASKVLVITGGPGVGKTTLVNSLLKILLAKAVAIALCAPTMVDVPLMRALLRALPERAALLLVGDVDQLPSVGPGQVLANVIASGAVPVVRLTEVFRQAAESQIIVNAHRINQGLMPNIALVDSGDFYFVDAADAEEAVRKLLAIVQDRIPKRFGLDPIRDIQVLCPMNRGGLGARSLNIELQNALNPPGEVRIERFGWTFCPGDKVMQVENDYDKDVYNGDLGVISRIDMEEGELHVGFDGREVTYGFGELDELVLAYATTIHKSQGSEYPAVVTPLSTQHYPMLQRNLVYTGVTRGKRLVVLVGQRKALAIAVKGARARRRWSKLGDWLALEHRLPKLF